VSPSDSLPKVYYPFGGRHFLLNWRTDYDQGHLLVARTEAQIEKMFVHILDEVPVKLCGERWQHETGNDLADPIDRRLRVSCARQAENDEVLLTAVGDYGPHQQGVYLGDPRFGNEPVLFFFKHIRDLDRDPYMARVEALRRERQKAYESEQQADRKASEIRVALEIEKTINFFTRAGVEDERSPKCPS
jgi:hypothetical protein